MPSTYRIPRATITGAYGRLLEAYARRTWGQVPDNPTSCGTTARP